MLASIFAHALVEKNFIALHPVPSSMNILENCREPTEDNAYADRKFATRICLAERKLGVWVSDHEKGSTENKQTKKKRGITEGGVKMIIFKMKTGFEPLRRRKVKDRINV